MTEIPSISSQIDENKIFNIIDKNFNKLSPAYFNLISNWLIRAYNVFGDIDKYLIVVYLINKDFIFFQRNGIIVNFDTFFKGKTLEIPKINISDISRDLQLPKESVRRKIHELEKNGVIKKLQKKIVVDRTVISKYFPTVNRMKTLNEVASLFYEFNKLLKDENEISEIFNFNQIVDSLKENYTFCWLEFNKFLFVFTNNWRKEVKDLETYSIGLVVMINAAMDKNFRQKNINMKSWQKKVQGTDERGVNAMSLSDITGIPRPTVVRKLKYLVKNNFLVINEKKLVSINMKGVALRKGRKLQDENILSLSNYIYIVFNQIKIINSQTDNNNEVFVPSYLRGF